VLGKALGFDRSSSMFFAKRCEDIVQDPNDAAKGALVDNQSRKNTPSKSSRTLYWGSNNRRVVSAKRIRGYFVLAVLRNAGADRLVGGERSIRGLATG
jgi:hypothetical protein